MLTKTQFIGLRVSETQLLTAGNDVLESSSKSEDEGGSFLGANQIAMVLEDSQEESDTQKLRKELALLKKKLADGLEHNRMSRWARSNSRVEEVSKHFSGFLNQ